eukprot:m.67726 g.67726  ORF g.67726 m.67726 type:complete len:639 (-) comp14133_c1_seq1:207-2123(-)
MSVRNLLLRVSSKEKEAAKSPKSIADDARSDIDSKGDDCTVIVTVHSASNLLAKDLDASSDPYCRIYVDNVLLGKTRTISSDLNPVWEESFEVDLGEVPGQDSAAPVLKIEIFNEYHFGKMKGQITNIGKQAFLGKIEIPLAKALRGRTSYPLEKRSEKSKVRGSIEVSARTSDPDCMGDRSTDPVHNSPAMRRKTHFSIGELVQATKQLQTTTELEPGSYLLKIIFSKAMDLPHLDEGKHTQIQFNAFLGNEKANSPQYQLSNVDENGSMNLTDCQVSLPVSVKDINSLPVLRIHAAIPGIVLDYSLGVASVKLDNIPVLLEEDHDVIVGMAPAEIFVEKKKLRVLPPYLRLRDNSGSVCRVRLKLWMIKLQSTSASDQAEADDDGSGGAAVAAEEDGGQDLAPPSSMPPSYEWVLLEADYPVSASRLHQIIFSEQSRFLTEFSDVKGYTEVSVSPWSDDKREFAYIMPKSTIVKANRCTELQEYIVNKSNCYVVNIQAETPEVQYGKDFVTLVQIAISFTNKHSSHLKVTAELKFSRTVMVKSLIQGGARRGLTATYQEFDRVLRKFARGKKVQLETEATEIKEVEHVVETKSSFSNISSVAGSIMSNAIQLVHLILLLLILWKLYQLDLQCQTRA